MGQRWPGRRRRERVVVKGLGISVVAIAAFVAFMAAGPGRAAEPSAVVKAPPAKQASPSAAKEGAPGVAKETAVRPSAATAGQDSKGSKDAKDAGPKAGEGEANAQRTASAPAVPGQRRAKSKRKHDGSADDEPELPPGQGPPPPSPLTVNDLHQEANRERGPGGDFNAPPRVKLEQLLSELGRARQSLHDDTVKLEALAGNEPSRGGESASADAPAAPGAPAQPPQKNPLDVLAKALRGIKPEQAGPIVARLDKGLAATVLLKMPPVDAGKIMGALKPEVAAELATQIAMRAPSPHAGGKR